jgi:plasmid maintenance system antidote protein VapI
MTLTITGMPTHTHRLPPHSLKDYMKQNNITVVRAAAELNVSRQHIYDMLRGDAYPSRKLALRIEDWSQGELKKEGLIFGNAAEM